MRRQGIWVGAHFGAAAEHAAERTGAMKNLKFQKPVSDRTLILRIAQQYGLSISQEDQQLLSACSKGVPLNRNLDGMDENLFVSRFVSLSPQDAGNILSLSRQINQESDTQFYLPIACDGFGTFFCIKFKQRAPCGIFWLNDAAEEVKVAVSLSEFLQKLRCK